MMEFQGKRIVLTGVSRGIGFVCAHALLKKGASVLGVARDAERLKRSSRELSRLGDFAALSVDVGDRHTGAAVARRVRDRWGALDVLINNAAILASSHDFESEAPDLLEKTLRINVIGPHRLILALFPFLRKGEDPRIVNVTSGAGMARCLRTELSDPSYRLSKYCLNGLTLQYARLMKGTVAVNSLDPGWVRTDMGGLDAPEEPERAGERVIALLRKPHTETGKVWYGESEIPL